MKADCLNQGLVGVRLVAGGLIALVALVMSGCATGGSTVLAPRSNVTREHALSLAQHTATIVGGDVFTVSATGSMKPTLDEGSIVTVEHVEFSQLRKGDIVIYRSLSGTPVIHRLYEHANDRWLVLGDNNPSVDHESVNAGNLLGRVCAIFYTSTGSYASAPTAAASR